MTDRLNLTTPTLDAVLHALIDPARTEFEIRHLDLGRDRSVWLAALRREIAGASTPAIGRAATDTETRGAGAVALGISEEELAAAPTETPAPRSIALLRQTLSMLCHFVWHRQTRPGEHLWTIPVDKERDFDCIFSDAINELERLRAACADQPWQPRVAELASELRQNCCVAPDGSTIYVNGPRILRVAKQLEALLPAPPSPAAKETP